MGISADKPMVIGEAPSGFEALVSEERGYSGSRRLGAIGSELGGSQELVPVLLFIANIHP